MRLIYHCIVFVSSRWQVGNCLHCADEASHCPYPKRGRVETNLLKQEPIHVLKLGNQCTNLSKSPAALSVSSSNIFVFPFVILIPVWNNRNSSPLYCWLFCLSFNSWTVFIYSKTKPESECIVDEINIWSEYSPFPIFIFYQGILGFSYCSWQVSIKRQ